MELGRRGIGTILAMAALGRLDSTMHDLIDDGYSVSQDLLDSDLVATLASLAKQRHANGQLVRARIG